MKTAAISQVAWGPNRLDVFGIGTDGAMYDKAREGDVWEANWDDLGGTFILTLPAPPPRTSTRSSQHSGQHCGVRLRESH